MNSLLTVAELAATFNVKPEYLRRRLPKLREKHGFPPPVPGLGNRYDPLAITAWRNRCAGLEQPDQLRMLPDLPDTLTPWQETLDQRARSIGSAG